MSMVVDVQEQKKLPERETCRKDMESWAILLGRDVKNGTTVIAGWSAI